jgi:hypothetical protein
MLLPCQNSSSQHSPGRALEEVAELPRCSQQWKNSHFQTSLRHLVVVYPKLETLSRRLAPEGAKETVSVHLDLVGYYLPSFPPRAMSFFGVRLNMMRTLSFE